MKQTYVTPVIVQRTIIRQTAQRLADRIMKTVWTAGPVMVMTIHSYQQQHLQMHRTIQLQTAATVTQEQTMQMQYRTQPVISVIQQAEH
jgi:hypothetical protein